MDTNSIRHALELADDLANFIGTGYGTGRKPEPTPKYFTVVETKMNELTEALIEALEKEVIIEHRVALFKKHRS